MGKPSGKTDKWKSEELREERKARLAEMKAKDGGKKPVRANSKVTSILLIIVLILAVLGAGLWGAFKLGLPHQHLTALTVGSEKVNAIEFNYYYHNIAGQFQLDPSDKNNAQTLKSESGIEGFATVEDYLKDVAAQQVQMNVMLATLAEAENIALSDEEYAIIEDFYIQIDAGAKQSGLGPNAFLSAQYGQGASKESLRPVLERYLLAQKYSLEKQDDFTFTNDEIEKYYQENKSDYDRVSYRLFNIKAETEVDADEEEEEEAFKAAKGKASEMLAAVEDEASFRQACLDFAADSEEKESYEQKDKSRYFLKLKNSVAGTDAAEWLFDQGRTKGDKTIIETSTGYQVILFLEANDSNFPYVNINHILFKADRSSAEEAELDKAKERAEEILELYNQSAKTVEAFAELAQEYSEDTSALDGGLISSIYPGQTEAEFEEWAYAKNRKIGDTGIVQTSYGYHVMYYAGTDDKTDRQLRITDKLKSDAYNDYVNGQLENYNYKINKLGYRLTT